MTRAAPLGAALLLAALVAAGCSGGPAPEWGAVRTYLEREYPDVETVSGAALEAALADEARAPLLLDARTQEEYAVSHLPGARPAGDDAALARALTDVPPERPIVAYCSVGVRSARLVRRLTAAGHTDVRNLEGSLFRWAQEDRPLVRAGRPTRCVHPFDERWGRLVPADRHCRSSAGCSHPQGSIR